MKARTTWIACLSLLLTVSAGAQSRSGSPKKKEATRQTTIVHQKTAVAKKQDTASGRVALFSQNSYAAYRPGAVRLQVSDTTLRLLNARANGLNTDIDKTQVLGIPKGATGFADGKLILHPTSAVSSGTATGSGSVGTGTSPGSVGSAGRFIGVNGKSPYAEAGTFGRGTVAPADKPQSNAGQIRQQ